MRQCPESEKRLRKLSHAAASIMLGTARDAATENGAWCVPLSFLPRTAGALLFHVHRHGIRGDPVTNDSQVAQAGLHVLRYIEVGGCRRGVSNRHRAVVVRAGIVDFAVLAVGE